MTFAEPIPTRRHDPAVGIVISRGLRLDERPLAAHLFWQAFSDKLARVLNPQDKAVAYLARILYLDNTLCARDAAGRLVGVAGLKTAAGGMLGGGWDDLSALYGVYGASWRGPVLDLTSRAVAPGQMLLDGLFVSKADRNQGIGSALIEAVMDEARRQGLREVRLDVVDTNPRARALYHRHGFHSISRSRPGLLRLVFGFRSSEQMVRPV